MKPSLTSLFKFLFVFCLSTPALAINWQGIFIAGDHSIANFDNGREDIATFFSKVGHVEGLHFTSTRGLISPSRALYPATFDNLVKAFTQSPLKQNEGCLIHMTSHGTKGQGFYLSLSGIMPPSVFTKLVNQKCGQAPTIILVSACYSGQFITEEIKGPNRIILTAASADRPSFGCSADTQYTYWDGCLLEVLPASRTWVEAEARVRSCIARKEQALGVPSSNPQSFFGSQTRDWKILN